MAGSDLSHLYSLFPNLRESQHRGTSDADECYNCIAWAAEDTDHKWWPFAYPPQGYWPADIPREETIDAFVAAFRTLHYEPCSDGAFEPEVEKLAIYTKDDTVTHMARQLRNGLWTSKLGDLQDIEHATLEAVCCDVYGTVAQFMKRPRNS